MNENKNTQNNSVGSTHRLPVNPAMRLPINPAMRLPVNPYYRITGNSGNFIENFTVFKNTETKWNVMGFSKTIEKSS